MPLNILTEERREDLKNCYMEVLTYPITNNLALLLTYVDEDGYEEPYCDITVNIIPLKENQGCIDINNAPWLIDWIEETGIAKDTGGKVSSGYVTYPIYKFDLEKLEMYKKKGE